MLESEQMPLRWIRVTALLATLTVASSAQCISACLATNCGLRSHQDASHEELAGHGRHHHDTAAMDTGMTHAAHHAVQYPQTHPEQSDAHVSGHPHQSPAQGPQDSHSGPDSCTGHSGIFFASPGTPAAKQVLQEAGGLQFPALPVSSAIPLPVADIVALTGKLPESPPFLSYFPSLTVLRL